MLCAVGDLLEDVVVWLSGPPGVGTDTAARVFRRRGGSAANVTAHCVANGSPARFVGQVGDDALGSRLIDELSAACVDVRAVRGGRTGSIVVLVAPDGERTMLTDRGAALELATVDDEWLDDVTVLHLPAYSLTVGSLAQTAVVLAGRARTRGATVSIDASSIATLAAFGPARFLDLVRDLEPDVLLMNRDEAALLGVVAAAPTGVGLAVVHCGGDTATAYAEHGLVAAVAPAEAVGATDTTGAGDAFAAGMLPAIRAGATVADAMAAGHRAAARTLRAPGASIGGTA